MLYEMGSRRGIIGRWWRASRAADWRSATGAVVNMRIAVERNLIAARQATVDGTSKLQIPRKGRGAVIAGHDEERRRDLLIDRRDQLGQAAARHSNHGNSTRHCLDENETKGLLRAGMNEGITAREHARKAHTHRLIRKDGHLRIESLEFVAADQ